ncbi:MAG: PAS domain-containing protein [Candidatus Sericytochromatia bacterium]|nr:PAS domain-containing protein [Candidatus Sericytochromatia bacterium]
MPLNLPCKHHQQLSQAQFYQLLRSDQRISNFMQEAATDGLWYLQADKTGACWFNQRFWRTLGYAADQYPPGSQAWLQSLPPEEAAQTLAYLKQLLTAEQGHEAILNYRHTSGHSLWLKSTGRLLRNARGEAEHLLVAHTDITNLKKKEILLTRCNHEARIGYWDVDLIHQQIFWSEMTCEIHGVPSDYQPDITTAINFFEAGWSRETITKLFNEAIQQGKPYKTELPIITAQDQKKWVRALGIPEMHQDRCIRVYGTFQDIEAEKQASLSLEASEQKMRSIFNSTFSFIGFLNPDGTVLEANETALNMAGLKPEDVIGKPFWECYWWQISAETQAELRHNLALAAAGQERVYEVNVWIANQTPITILFSLRPIFNAAGEVIYIIPEGWPVQEIVDTRERYKHVLDATEVGIWEWNVQTGETNFNERWAEIIGYTLDELQPVSIKTWQRFTHPEDLARSEAQLQAYFKGETNAYEVEYRMRHKAGHWVWVLDRGKALSWTPEGQPLMMYGTHMEITERKETEKRIQKLLEISNNQNERLKNFARIVTHNLRSHAGGINGLLKVLQKRHPELYSHEVIGMLQKAADNLSETIQELTEVASADLSTALAKSKLPLRETVSRVLESLQSEALQNKVNLLNEVPENFTVQAIPAYISSLVLNFATNAIKYHDPRRPGQLQIQAWHEEHWDVLAFIDQGLGIDLARYGERLFQMYQTFHTHEDSRGIGLYLTKTQVEAMGGKITVESRVGEGSCFKVYLPRASVIQNEPFFALPE